MKFGKRTIACVMTAAAVLASSIVGAGACTGVYVGKDVSASGYTMFGRSEDIGSAYNKIFFVHEAGDHKAGETYVDGYGHAYTYKTDSYRYTALKDDPNAEDFGEYASEDLTSYEEAGVNEHGVALTATVTIHSTDKIVGENGTDPNVPTGIDEISYATILLGQSKTAREGVELLAEIVEQDGAADNHCIMIGDKNEVWYMEVLSGHQYVAYKLPDDVVLVNPNVNMIAEVDVNDTENYLVSDQLIEVAQEAGTFVGDADAGIINVQQSYGVVADGNGFDDSGRYRIAMGQNFLNESMNVTPDQDEYAFTFTPDRKISVEDLTEFFAQHGEGTIYDSYKDTTIRGISTNRQAETHIFEIRDDLPTELSVVQWQAMAMADYSVFVPYYSVLLDDTLAAYQVEGTEYTDGSAYWAFQRVAELANNDHDGVGVQIRAAYDELQKKFIDEFAAQEDEMAAAYAEDPAAARTMATELGMEMAQEAIDLANSLYAEYAGQGFTDVPADSWYADAVQYVTENGLMNGTEETAFGPDETTTRGMIVAILYRMEGEPEAEASDFTDVNADAYYADAVAWANANGIVTGYGDGLFGPDDTITREQMAAILYRYAQYKGYDVTTTGSLDAYTDAAQISNYALTAMQWANEQGLITGSTSTTLEPQGNAIRAEAATILMRFCENIAK
ncbi:MAG TPA: C69 family dipeptidase [Candidatus Agathobaculum stercoravium]|nr:C69 family dipeptidase [Candidatus Agathobaculum stercoravium]